MTIHQWAHGWYRFTKARFFLRSASQVSVSQWTARRNVYGPHAQLWFCELTLDTLDDEQWMPIEAFIAQLGGQAGLMRIGDVSRLEPQYNKESAGSIQSFSDGTFFTDGTGFNSTPLPQTIYVTTAAARGETSIVVGGLPASTARVLRRNDAIEIQPNGMFGEMPHFYAVMKDAPTDANGDTRLEIRPGLRSDIAAGDTVVMSYPQSVFRLMDEDQGVFERSAPTFANMSFKLIEAIP